MKTRIIGMVVVTYAGIVQQIPVSDDCTVERGACAVASMAP